MPSEYIYFFLRFLRHLIFTNSNRLLRMLQAGSQRVPQVEQLVGKKEAIVLVGFVLEHLVRPPLEESLQLIVSVLPDEFRSLLRQRQTFLNVTGAAEAD